ncbi:MAG: GNAT family N-acetyltransferase [Stackebrandtia sp.]
MLSLSLDHAAELRPLEPWNAAEFAEFMDMHREFLAPWLPMAHRVSDVDSSERLLRRFADRQATDSGRIYGIWDGGVLVGGTMFRVFETDVDSCELGVWLSPGAIGRGLVTRAAELMVDWAVYQRGMNRVGWLCDTRNEASKAVARRLGMTHEGTLRQLYVVDGRRVDAEMWAVLADEWRARESGDAIHCDGRK